ncbi:hypothetical protein AB0471_37490 [Streptomyces sp. NPDC052002]|uniref:hypothetical protein n=1 Tax=Streptomyces sp. NPDC052002 TaxID=3155754 RepID=UPI00344E97D3
MLQQGSHGFSDGALISPAVEGETEKPWQSLKEVFGAVNRYVFKELPDLEGSDRFGDCQAYGAFEAGGSQEWCGMDAIRQKASAFRA